MSAMTSKFRVATNHGTFDIIATSADDARCQAARLTYGQTRVYSVDAVNANGKTGWEMLEEEQEEAKRGYKR